MKSRKIFISFFIGICLVLLFAASCSKKGNTNDQGIIVNLSVEPKTIDPSLNAQIYGVIYISHVFEGLTVRDSDNKIVPGVAESWEIIEELFKMDNVIITPHFAFYTDEALLNMVSISIDNIFEFKNTGKCINQIKNI